MAALVLRWRVPPPVLTLRWRIQEEATYAQQVSPSRPIATVIGPSGRDGEDGATAFAAIAAVALSGHRAVKAVDAGVDYPSSAVAADGDLIVGITTHAADALGEVKVQAGGAIEEPSWNWSIGPIFAGDSGTLTQTPPSGAWLRQIATAIAPTRIVINLRPTIQRLN